MAGAIYDFTGVVEKVLPTKTFPSGFSKRDVVLTDDLDSPSKYPNHLAFSFKKDNASVLDSIHEGQRVKVHFAIDGRKWTNQQGEDKYFTDLTGLKVEVMNGDGSSTEPVPAPAEPPAGEPEGGNDDSVPF